MSNTTPITVLVFFEVRHHVQAHAVAICFHIQQSIFKGVFPRQLQVASFTGNECAIRLLRCLSRDHTYPPT
jgi:signal-transduction protein with cAMP-binding, CBS, and nucleotidyltransferase domain